MTEVQMVLFLLVLALGGLIWTILDVLLREARYEELVARFAEEAKERRRLARESILASQKTLARTGYYRGPLEGPGAGVAGAHHREAMNAWAKDVWAGRDAPHGSPERERLDRITRVY